MSKFPTRLFICTGCGALKQVIMNHDQLNEIFERCTEKCMWINTDGPKLYSKDGEETGFRKRRMTKAQLVMPKLKTAYWIGGDPSSSYADKPIIK